MSLVSDALARLQRVYQAHASEKLMVTAVLDNRLKRKAIDEGVPFRCIKRVKSAACGMNKLKKLMSYLQSFRIDGQARNPHQVQLHKGMISAVLHGMFRHDSEAALKVAMSAFNLLCSNQLYAALAPRRFGKTKAVAMFVAAYAVACPGTVTSIFSTAQRASGDLLGEIKVFVEAIPNGGFKVERCNQETMVLRDGKLRTRISSYPGRADT
jgi:hypothetical protein